MIRFVDLSDQICEGVREFAFYNTITDKFMEFSDTQTWSTVEQFEKDYDGPQLERHLRLIPKEWNPSTNC